MSSDDQHKKAQSNNFAFKQKADNAEYAMIQELEAYMRDYLQNERGKALEVGAIPTVNTYGSWHIHQGNDHANVQLWENRGAFSVLFLPIGGYSANDTFAQRLANATGYEVNMPDKDEHGSPVTRTFQPKAKS